MRRWFWIGMLAFVFCPLQAQDLTVLGVFPDRALVELNGERRVLRVGEDAGGGIRLLSTDTRAGVIWLEIHGERRQVARGGRSGDRSPVRQAARTRIFPDAAGNFMVPGSINGHAVSFQVDTGVGAIVMSAAEARRLGIDYARGEPTRVHTDSGQSFGYRVKLDQVRVGNIEQRDMAALVVQSDVPPSRLVLLGMSFLDRLEMRHEGRTLILEQRR